MANISRRTFLATSSCVVTLPALVTQAQEQTAPLHFGVITDLHQDIIPDAPDRLRAFVEAMTLANVDFICQLGDFCIPKPANQPLMKIWNSFPGPKYHVLGNHDMDAGYKPQVTAEFYGMPARYYAFSAKGVRFIVLDGNEPGGQKSGYARYIGPDQIAWLKTELEKSNEPVIVLIHQPLETDSGIENHAAIQKILEGTLSNKSPVVAVFAGHLHQDYVRPVNGIPYIQINSAAYHWMGDRFAHESYSPEIHKQHPHLKSTCPYQDPLWAMVTVDLAGRTLKIEGLKTTWVGQSPWELGATEKSHPPEIVRPAISDQQVSLIR